ncbi:twin-arginine translocase subunit TatC [Chitinophaga sp. SYP-B3965]|uniref:twin-arginine translocase subunit TatC n=1 Tax=Chitinophaga sp. SYP-B3965 TaxID=2663120 RepID=UPI0012997090|nr:twin-arginine translocase subunit TatC [Chitinophaga sp. SYP-B3965]MRG46826.1 twin-arginine translocase subunit TatC [Chitinophaga sp. SYP-B3965]
MLKKLFSSNEDKAEMSFFDHLEELRWHLVRSAFAIVFVSILGFVFTDWILTHVIFGPTQPDFPTYSWMCKLSHALGMGDKLCLIPPEIKFQNTKMAGQITLQFKLAFMLGLIGAFPYIVYEFWRFIRPALKDQEAKGSKGIIFWITLQFLLGVLFSYFLIAPFMINFLASYTVSSVIKNDFFIDDYFGLMSQIILGMGCLFEMPILVFFLTKLGLLTPDFMRTYRRHAIVVILILAAIITPPDVLDQLLVFIPLYLLYEISILISARAYKAKEKKEKEEWS